MILKTTDKELIAKALEDNMCGKFAYLPKLAADMSVTKNEITVINSHKSADMFNIICKAKSSKSEHIQQVIDVFTTRKLPFAWWTGFKDESNDLITQLERLHFSRTESELGMAVNLSELSAKDIFPELKIKSVDNDLLLNDFVSVLTELIPNDNAAIKEFYTSAKKFILDNNSALKLFVGYLNKKPVATSALFMHAGVAGIWDIVTLPEARRKGIGTDMTLHALNEGRKLGFSIGVLTASDEGQFVYSKLGFIPIQQFYIYNLTI